MVGAIEPAVRFYEEPPATGLMVESDGSQTWVSARDWAAAFAAAEPGTSHNAARDQVWEALLGILVDSSAADADDEEMSVGALHEERSRNEELTSAFNRAWPLLEPEDIVADLWSVPAFLHVSAPWLNADEVQKLQRADARAWTGADLPLLDAARQRVGDSGAARRKRRRQAAVAAERERMSEVIDRMIEADEGEGLAQQLRHHDLREALVDESALPTADPGLLVGPIAHVIVDEAQELTDAEWGMLLRRCPSRSFTIVGDRAQARHGFTESWQERLEQMGLNRSDLASLSINYRTPEEVMAEAEPVIRAAIPDANVPTSVRRSGVPVIHGSTSELDSILGEWLVDHEDGVACVIGDPTFPATGRVQSLAPELAKGLEFDLVVLMNPESFGAGIEGAVDRYVAMTRATQQLVILG